MKTEQKIELGVVLTGVGLTILGLLWIDDTVNRPYESAPSTPYPLPEIHIDPEMCRDKLLNIYTLRLRLLWSKSDKVIAMVREARYPADLVEAQRAMVEALTEYKGVYVPEVFAEYHRLTVLGYEAFIKAIEARSAGDLGEYNRLIDVSSQYLGQGAAYMRKISDACGLDPNMRVVLK